ncbi:MAG TPA: ABC transporter ATP-binding protein [Spirochaetales bacterium]|nr:ABC transporter ATP-binding protein [Spirochaetales bacterium]
MNDTPVITCSHVTKTFVTEAEQLTILHDISFEVPGGRTVSITGPSGCGKSTLLSLLGGLDRPTHGTIFIDGFSVHDTSETELARFRSEKLGFIFQFHFLLKDFSALENVMMPHLILYGNRQQARNVARELLGIVGLENRMHHYPDQLSGGERQRVAIARALINKPKVVLADEPTGNLDENNAGIIETILLETIRQFDTTLLLVTHDSDFAKKTDIQFRIHEGNLFTL